MKKLIAGLATAAVFAGVAALSSVPVQAEELKAIKTVAPEYPRGAERRNIEGYVVVQYTVTADGSVKDVKVVEADPEGVFDDAATAAVNQWKFEKPSQDVPNLQTKVTFKL